MNNKVYSIIDEFNESSLKKELDDIKERINSDEQTKELINKFNNAKELYERYDFKEEFIKAKKELVNNELIKRYLEIQNVINLLSLKINDKINKITNGE